MERVDITSILDWFIFEYGKSPEHFGPLSNVILRNYTAWEDLTKRLEAGHTEAAKPDVLLYHAEELLQELQTLRNGVLGVINFASEKIKHLAEDSRENIRSAAEQKGMSEKVYLEFLKDTESTTNRKVKIIRVIVSKVFDHTIDNLHILIERIKSIHTGPPA